MFGAPLAWRSLNLPCICYMIALAYWRPPDELNYRWAGGGGALLIGIGYVFGHQLRSVSFCARSGRGVSSEIAWALIKWL